MLNVEVSRGTSPHGNKSPNQQITRSTNGLNINVECPMLKYPEAPFPGGSNRQIDTTVDRGQSRTIVYCQRSTARRQMVTSKVIIKAV